MIEEHNPYSKVFTHHIFSDNKKYIRSYPMLPWFVNKNYDELKAMTDVGKHKIISWISSNQIYFAGHQKRMDFMKHIQNSDLDIDLYGKGINFIEDKWDGLAPYKYAFAIENSSSADYWTEKIADCFLSYTLPIYYGCTNIDQYFPKDSYIQIDINKPKVAIAAVKEAIQNNEYEKRYQAICKARELVLDKYNFFARISEEINEDYDEHRQKTNITLQPYKLQPYKKSLKRNILGLPVEVARLPIEMLRKTNTLYMR